MALTTSDVFGNTVMTGMGSPAEFTSSPILIHTLRLAAALAYEKYLRGNFGAQGAVLRGNFEVRALDVARNLVLDRLDGVLRFDFDGNTSLQDSFKLECGDAFDTYDT